MTPMPTAVKLLAVAVALLPGAMTCGCSPAPPSVMSPTSEQDPDRYAQARHAENKAKRQNQEAEKILMRKRRSPLRTK